MPIYLILLVNLAFSAMTQNVDFADLFLPFNISGSIQNYKNQFENLAEGTTVMADNYFPGLELPNRQITKTSINSYESVAGMLLQEVGSPMTLHQFLEQDFSFLDDSISQLSDECS